MKKLLFLSFLLLATACFAQEEDEDSAPKADIKTYSDTVEKKKLEGQKVTFVTDDKVTITGVFEESEFAGEDARYAILLPDLGKNKSSYAAFTAKLKNKGIGYLAIDLRGHGESAGIGHYSRFAKEGANNPFNKMVLDVNAAVAFLKNKKIAPKSIFIIGSGLGANVAAKSAAFNDDIGGVALLTPSTNNRDVLTISGIRVAKVPIFIASAVDVKKNFFEASIIRNTAFLTQGQGKVTFETAYDKEGTAMLDTYLSPILIQWLFTPERPEVKPEAEL